MYLTQLKLWNFRKFGKSGEDIDLQNPHLTVNFNCGLNLLAGENDSGKTCIIDAIKLVLRTHSYDWIRVEDEDFHKETNNFRIECKFQGLKDDEAKNFLEWFGMEKEKTAGGEQDCLFLRLILDVRRNQEKIFPYEVTAGLDNEGRTLSAEAKEYLKVVYLKPLRDAQAELVPKKNSRLSQILYGHPAFKNKETHKLIEIICEANDEIKKYFKDNTDGGESGKEILQTIQSYLENFFHKTIKQNSYFDITNPKLKQILETLKLTLDDERSGLGTYNLLFIATELLHLKKESYNGLKLGLIEEIEAHLHPQAQLRVIEALQEESKQSGIQLILTTHSPNLASKVHLKNLIICRDGKAFSMGYDYTCLEESDYSFLERFLDVTKANLFFARGVILVEGISESLLIPSIAKLRDKDLMEYGVSVVNVGNTAFLRYAKIFQQKNNSEMSIPVAVVTDLDVKPDEEEQTDNGQTKAEKKRQEKEKKYDGQSVKTFVSPHWTLEYCIALSPNLQKLLFEAVKSAADEMKHDGYSGKEIMESWEKFSELDCKQVAKEIYENLIVKKKISKSIIAQHLAKALEVKRSDHDFCKLLTEDENVKYIINAIACATGTTDGN